MAGWDGADRTVTVNGVRTRYRTGGEGEPVVLVHGFGGYLESWAEMAPRLSEQFAVYALDLPGHGGTETAFDDYGLPSLAAFLVEFMETVGIEEAHLVGQSFGACVVTATAQAHPDRVDHLALVAPAFLDGTVPVQFRVPALPVIGRPVFDRLFPSDRSDIEALAEQVINQPEKRTDAWVERTLRLSTRQGQARALHRIVRANLSVWGPRSAVFDPLETFLESTSRPLLIVHGREDALIPVGAAQSLAETAENATLQIADDSGHEVPHERPAELSGWLLDSLGATSHAA